jgi:transcriptional regulator with XRE-family HTH domain
MNIKEFLNRKYYELQSQKAGKINIEEFAEMFGAKQPLMSKWLNGRLSPGPEYKQRIIEHYGEEAILAFGEDPDLYAIKENWEHLSPAARRTIREQSEKLATMNEPKRAPAKHRTSTP